MADEALVLVTCPADEAERIASALVEQRLAACVNMIPAVTSIYRWQGKTCKEQETLLLIKSSARVYAALETKIRELHSYEVPEIILLPIVTGSNSYLDWINCQLGELALAPGADPGREPAPAKES